MFEKEAEEYTSNLDECRTKDLMKDAFKDGAEFGYNKCNEQLTKAKELIKELSSSLSVVGECEEEECELLNRAEEFLIEVEK